MKRVLPILGLALFIVVVGFFAIRADSMSNGAPQLDCVQCHAGADQNPAEFTIEGLPEQFEPGKTYKVTVKITKGPDCSGGVACGGLAVEANAGKLVVIDEKNTFISTISTGEELRAILTHTKDGSLLREWSFEWKAPEDATPVTFKISVIAANGDGGATGDAYAHKEITIKPAEKPKPTPIVTTKVVTEEKVSTVLTTTPAGTVTERNPALAVAVAIVLFIVAVAGYLVLARKK